MWSGAQGEAHRAKTAITPAPLYPSAVLPDRPSGYCGLLTGSGAVLEGGHRGCHCQGVRDIRGWRDPLVDDFGLDGLGFGSDRLHGAFPAGGYERI